MVQRPTHRLLAVGIACLLVAASLGAVSTSALAQSSDDSNVLDGWLDEDETSATTTENTWFDLEVDTDAWQTRLSATSAAFDGQFDRMKVSLSNAFSDDTARPNNETVAQTKREINANADHYVDAINNQTSPSTAFDTHKIIVSHEGSPNAALYLVGNVTTTTNNSTTLESITALNESEFNSSYANRSVDETWGVDGHFAEDFPTVADQIAHRIANNESLDRDYQGQLLGRYCGSTSFSDPGECDVRSTIWMAERDLGVEEWTPEDDEDDNWLPFTMLAPALGAMEVSRRVA